MTWDEDLQLRIKVEEHNEKCVAACYSYRPVDLAHMQRMGEISRQRRVVNNSVNKVCSDFSEKNAVQLERLA